MAQQGRQMRVGARDLFAYYSVELVLLIDYRCDDEKKKLLCWGDILVLRSWRLQDSKNAGH